MTETIAPRRFQRTGFPLLAAAATTGLMLAGLSACQRQPVQCTAESAQEPLVAAIKTKLERDITKAVRGGDGSHTASLSKIRASIAQLVIAIEDVRTSKEDPDSTKRFCTGQLRIRFPADVLTDADRARQAADLNSVTDLADDAGIERHADSFTNTIDFNVQPTDDGSKVFAEAESGDSMFTFTAELLASALARASVEEGQRAQQQASDQATAEQNAALAEQRSATVASARTENQLATQTINAVWSAIPNASRARLLPLQRAWIRKKAADCAVEAAAASTEPADKEVARLSCDTRATQERSTFLNDFRGEEPVAATPEPAAVNENEGF